MSALVVDSRSRSRPRAPHGVGPRSESLETRRLLDASMPIVTPSLSFAIGLAAAESSPINVAAGSEFAPGFAVTGLEPGTGLATPGQTLTAFQASVSLPPITSAIPPLSGPSTTATSFGPSATGPSTTLNPLGNDTETAVAAASEVAQPTPGRSDRISNIVVTTPIIPLPHIRPPEPALVNPAPRRQPNPPVKAPAPPVQPPVQQPAEPAVPKAVEPAPATPVRPIEVEPAPVPKVVPTEPKEPMSLHTWDAAIELVEADLSEGLPASLSIRMEESMAAGALLAAWAGWNYGSRLEGFSRRRPFSPSLPSLEAGPGAGSGR